MRRLLLVSLVVACRDVPKKDPPKDPPVDDAAPPVVADPGPPPLAAEWIEKLDLPDGGVGYVTPPVGAREPRPIIVAVHGAWDDPGLTCSAWRLIVDVYAFVVCPGGRPVDPSKEGRLFVWSSGEHIAKRVHDALAATKAKFPGRVAEDAPMIYVAFSQGSNLAGTLLSREAKSFPRVVFTEGGYRTFDDASTARAFAKGGGERVLMTCSQPGCAGMFAGSRAALEHAGIAARVDYSGPHGHSMPPAVREQIHDAMPWIVAGLHGWEGYRDAPKLAGH
jgi:hypothetical protein